LLFHLHAKTVFIIGVRRVTLVGEHVACRAEEPLAGHVTCMAFIFWHHAQAKMFTGDHNATQLTDIEEEEAYLDVPPITRRNQCNSSMSSQRNGSSTYIG